MTDEELIMVLLGSGTQKWPIRKLAQQITKKGDLYTLRELAPGDLSHIPGLGQAQSSKIIAAIELGRRLFQPSPLPRLLTRDDALREVADIRHKQREYFVGLYLNARHQLIHKEVLTIGGLNYTSFQPRDVFVPALKYPCAFIIVAHNHPSGDATPSQEDKDITQELKKAGELLGITLLEHLIVGPTSHTSVG